MTKYLTIYILMHGKQRHRFCSFLYAKSERDARRLIKLRGLGEKIDGHGTNSQKNAGITKPTDLHFPHWLMFLAFVTQKAGYSAEDTTGDTGILHEMLHKHYFPDYEIDRTAEYQQLLINLGFMPYVN